MHLYWDNDILTIAQQKFWGDKDITAGNSSGRQDHHQKKKEEKKKKWTLRSQLANLSQYNHVGENHQIEVFKGQAMNESGCKKQPGAQACFCLATAVMRAAPFPLPSSDGRKATVHWGAKPLTVSSRTREKLE